MKLRFLLPLILTLFVGSLHVSDVDTIKSTKVHPGSVDTSTIRVKVLTYNVLGGRNTDGKRNLGRLADVINTFLPDVVALQEVDRKTRRLNGIDLPAELAERTGMNFVFGRAMDYDGGEYGEAVLTRLPIVDVTNHKLPHLEDSEPRVALAVTLRIPDSDQTFVFIGTHLDHQRSPEDRIAQATSINEISDRYDGKPLILAGDLNATPDSEPMRILYSKWSDAWPPKQDGYTYPSETPRRRIDYILYRPADRWSVTSQYRGIDIHDDDEEWTELLLLASDHLPLTAEFTIQID